MLLLVITGRKEPGGRDPMAGELGPQGLAGCALGPCPDPQLQAGPALHRSKCTPDPITADSVHAPQPPHLSPALSALLALRPVPTPDLRVCKHDTVFGASTPLHKPHPS